MKKLFAVLSVLFVMGTASVFAKGASFAIGAQAGVPLGGALTFKVPSVPCVFAVNFGGGYIGGTADWWMANPSISGSWGYYYGAGIYAGVGGGIIAAAPRLFVGTNVFILKGLVEFYLQAAWQPTLYIGGSDGFNASFAEIPVNAGFRFWL